MISINKKIKSGFALLFASMIFISSCNKDPLEIPEEPQIPATGSTLGDTLKSNADDSLYYRLVVRAGMANMLNVRSTSYTMFVPNNNAMKAFINAISAGAVPLTAPDAVFSGFITSSIPATTAASIVGYNIIPQAVPSSNFGTVFPNLQYPTILNPAPSISPLLRLTTFPSARNGNWVNNVPLTSVDEKAANGYIHHSLALIAPPQRYLWDRINTDADLTYLKAAIQRADSGTAAPGYLQSALLNIGANLTVFAPTDNAFKTALTGAIAQGLIRMGVPPATALTQATGLASTPGVFQNPQLYSVLTAQTVQGLVVYHLLGSRAFTNNFPTTPTNYPTLLNGVLTTHPGVQLSVTFGVPFPTAATVKGQENATPSNIIINSSPLMPDPTGTSDQNYLNGVLHKIDQVLLPLPL